MVKRLRRGVENVLITKTIRVCDAESHRKAHARTSISFATEEVLELPWDHGLRFGVESTREQRHTYIRLGKTVGARRYEQFFSYIRIQPGPADDPLPSMQKRKLVACQTDYFGISIVRLQERVPACLRSPTLTLGGSHQQAKQRHAKEKKNRDNPKNTPRKTDCT